MAVFIPDIMSVLRRYNILHFVEEYYDKEVFPSKSRLKSIVKSAIKWVHEYSPAENLRNGSREVGNNLSVAPGKGVSGLSGRNN